MRHRVQGRALFLQNSRSLRDTYYAFACAYDERAHHSRTIVSGPSTVATLRSGCRANPNSASSTTSTSGAWPVLASTDVATARSSAGKRRSVRLIPMPTTTARPDGVSTVSASMPHSFFSLTRISLGHLMSVCKRTSFEQAHHARQPPPSTSAAANRPARTAGAG